MGSGLMGSVPNIVYWGLTPLNSRYKSRNLWPASAYWGLNQVNRNLKTGYSAQKIVDIMWNYVGGGK
jgi:hypothetical protein